MIFWQDFFLDPKFGPTLVFRTDDGLGTSRNQEDASKIQETGQDTWPARMVGLSSHDSNQLISMEAERGPSAESQVRTEGGA